MMRMLMAVVMSCWCGATHAAVWTDMWWNPNESGWGVNVAQQGNVLFLTWYVYDSQGRATWYSGAAFRGSVPPSGYAAYSGDVYESSGPWLGSGSFNPNNVSRRRVGAVTFSPTAAHRANLAYSVDGVTVQKTIERMTWTHIPLSGSYLGGFKTNNRCGVSAPTDGIIEFDVAATVAGDGVSGAMVTDVYLNGYYQCRLFGNYRQYGSVYNVINTAVCGTTLGQIGFADLSRSDEGMEGDMNVRTPTGCQVNFAFSAAKVR